MSVVCELNEHQVSNFYFYYIWEIDWVYKMYNNFYVIKLSFLKFLLLQTHIVFHISLFCWLIITHKRFCECVSLTKFKINVKESSSCQRDVINFEHAISLCVGWTRVQVIKKEFYGFCNSQTRVWTMKQLNVRFSHKLTRRE